MGPVLLLLFRMVKKRKHKLGPKHRNARPSSEGGEKIPNFSPTVKSMWKLIQGLHHSRYLGSLEQGQLPKAFNMKKDELSRFWRPSGKNESFMSSIKNIGNLYFDSAIKILIEHYKVQALDMKVELEKCSLKSHDFKAAQDVAIKWARKNYGKKLKEETISEFQGMMEGIRPAEDTRGDSGLASPVRDLTRKPESQMVSGTDGGSEETVAILQASDVPPPVRVPTLTPVVMETPASGDPTPTPKPTPTPEPVPIRSRHHSAPSGSPKTDRSPRTGDSSGFEWDLNSVIKGNGLLKGPQTGLSFAGALNKQTPVVSTPTKRKRGDTSPASSPEGLTPEGKRERRAQTPQEKGIPPTPPTKNDAPGTSSMGGSPPPEDKVASPSPQRFRRGKLKSFKPCNARSEGRGSSWVMPEITHKRIALGDSNIYRVTKSSSQNLQLISFPGAKFYTLKGFLANGLGKDVRYPMVEELVLSVGINERKNNIKTTSTPQLNKLIRQVQHRFPKAKIYMADLQWSPDLPESEVVSLTELSEALKALPHSTVKNFPKVTMLAPLPRERFSIDPNDQKDKIHWSTECANAMLEHWLDCLN